MLLSATGLLAFSSLAAASVLMPRDPPASYGPWNTLGCWTDSPVNRTLHWQIGSSPTRTVENCLDSCTAAGFPLAGIEFGSECFCGNSILYNYGPSTGCTFACSGDTGEICGGPNAINIYHSGDLPYTVGPAAPVYGYNGWSGYGGEDVYEGLCYEDGSFSEGGNGRLNNQILIPIESMTVEKCLDACAAGNYRIGGLIRGQECWCDYHGAIKEPIGENRPNSECSYPCTGDATEFCGGRNNYMAYVHF